MKRDDVFVKHILDEIEFLKKQSCNLRIEDLLKDEVLKRAFARSIEIIGEAAKNISNSTKEQNPDIEWRKIDWMRDRLIHAYFGIDWNIVWDVIKNRLPEMEERLEAIKIEELGP